MFCLPSPAQFPLGQDENSGGGNMEGEPNGSMIPFIKFWPTPILAPLRRDVSKIFQLPPWLDIYDHYTFAWIEVEEDPVTCAGFLWLFPWD